MKLILQAIKSFLARLNSRIETLISDTAVAISAIDGKADKAVDTVESLKSTVNSNRARLDSLANAVITQNYIRIDAGGSNTEGRGCIAAGYSCVAIGDGTAAFGYGAVARSQGQTAIGRYNLLDADNIYSFIIGNGAYALDRSNAHTLDWDGNAWFAGTVESTGLILTAPGGKRFKMTVGNDGTLTTTEVTI